MISQFHNEDAGRQVDLSILEWKKRLVRMLFKSFLTLIEYIELVSQSAVAQCGTYLLCAVAVEHLACTVDNVHTWC